MNRFIAEKVFNKCWHEWEWIPGGGNRCKNCNYDPYVKGDIRYTMKGPLPKNPDYSTRDKAALMDKCVGEEWWSKLIVHISDNLAEEKYTSEAELIAYLWRNLPQLVAEYHGYKGEVE